MKPNFCTRISQFLTVVIFFMLFISKGYSQTQENLDFKYKVKEYMVDNTLKYTVTITVTKGDGPFCYELCDKALALGGKSLKKSENISEKSFVFDNLERREYFVYVYLPNQDFGKGKKIQLK